MTTEATVGRGVDQNASCTGDLRCLFSLPWLCCHIGHLGELTRIVPFELADAVLDEEGGLERRVRLLPSRVGLYFLLAMCLFPQPGYLGVWGKLTAGLRV